MLTALPRVIVLDVTCTYPHLSLCSRYLPSLLGMTCGQDFHSAPEWSLHPWSLHPIPEDIDEPTPRCRDALSNFGACWYDPFADS